MSKKNIEIELTEQEKTDVDILKTIYDDVIKVGDGRYAIQLGKNKGLSDKVLGISVDTLYEYAIYRDKYAIFHNSVKAKNKLIFFSTKEEVELIDMEDGVAPRDILEHSELDFSLLEVRTADNTDDFTVFDTNTGRVVMTYNHLDTTYWRPFNNDIILAVISNDGDIQGLTKGLEAGSIEELLNKLYKTVEVKKGRQVGYICTNADGETIELNKFGQVY